MRLENFVIVPLISVLHQLVKLELYGAGGGGKNYISVATPQHLAQSTYVKNILDAQNMY